MSGFDHWPDQDVFKAFWSSECYHWFLRENTVELCVCFNDLLVMSCILGRSGWYVTTKGNMDCV